MKNAMRRYSTAVATAPELRGPAGPRLAEAVETVRVDMPDLPDEELFELYQGGDDAAFTELVRRYEPLIKGFLFKRLKDEERVQDLTQDTFLRVHRARARYDSGRKFSTWIYTIASNLLKNEYRNRSRRRETAFSDLRAEGTQSRAIEFESDAPDPERTAYRGELREVIENAIDRLEDHHRIPFVMREVEDRTYEEISEAIGVPVGTVKSRLFRARNAFQSLLPFSVS